MNKKALVKSLSFGIALIIGKVNAANISLDQITKDVTVLAGDEMKGRANFSKEIEQAANYISKRYQDIGLKTFAKNDNFLQSFSVFHISPKSLQLNLNNKTVASENIAIASSSQSLLWQQKPATVSENVVLDSPKLHFISANEDMREALGNINQSGGKNLVFIDPTHTKMFKRYQQHFQQGLTKLALSPEHALVMVLTADTKVDSYQVNATALVEERSLHNVVGVLPGKSKADEIVIYSAHYDHLGATTTSDSDDKVYNGADDDASGTSAIINLAHYFSEQNNNERTLVFSAFSAEEIGGFGSRHFSEQLSPDSIVAMINIEMIGKTSKFGEGQLWMTGIERSNLGELLNQQLTSSQAKIHADPYPEQQLFYRSDNATLARLGVPAHSFSSTQIDKDQHYHQVSDDLASLNLSSMKQVIDNLAVATTPLVKGIVTPTRVDTEQVKAKGKIY